MDWLMREIRSSKKISRRSESEDPRYDDFCNALPKCKTDGESVIVREASNAFKFHIEQLRQMIRSLKGQIEEQRKELENEQAEAKAKNDKICRGLRAEIETQDRYYQRNMADTKEEHAREIQSLEQSLGRQAESFRRDAANMQARHDTEIQSLQKQQHVELLRLKQEHQSEVHYQRNQVAELNKALLSRDDEVYSPSMFSTSSLPEKTDATLKESFSEIVAMVDDISRSTWSTNQNVWSEETLWGFSGQHGLRRLKRAILQDLVWSVLYCCVFASPFRIFGGPGRMLEQEWTQSSGQDSLSAESKIYAWPPASAQMERWRYMTMLKCREVLTHPISGWDARAGLKKGYSDNLVELTKQLKTALQDIAPADEQVSTNLTKLSKKAAKTWLEFSMHRPRVVVEMTGRGSTELSQRIVQIRRGEAVLTLIPALRRYGNSEGADLDKLKSLTEGESLALSWSR